ncbi:MAG: hypothetical protein ACYDCO_21785 [Armatimonadota bacterium]
MHSVAFRFMALLGLVLGLWHAVSAGQPSLQAFSARLPGLRGQIPALVHSAERCAAVTLAHPRALVTMPRQVQEPFAAELLARAGGLGGAWYTDKGREKAGEPDIVLLTVRSWETHAERILPLIADYRGRGWTVVVFASAAGKPADLPADCFIDNGAPSAGKEHGAVNLLANTALGWMWVCEYAAAMSRQGKFPGILYSVAMPGAKEHNKPLQTAETRGTQFPCEKAIPAGELAERYLTRTEGLVADCRSERIQRQVAQAAEIVAARMKAGNTVGLSGMGHYIIDEVRETDLQAPWKAFRGTGKNPFTANLQPGDLLVWITYLGMRTAYQDVTPQLQEAGVELISSYAVDPEWSKNQPPMLALIEQCWQLPDAEVPIPIFPHVMAPVSGLNAGLVLRMLDEEVAARLKN